MSMNIAVSKILSKGAPFKIYQINHWPILYVLLINPMTVSIDWLHCQIDVYSGVEVVRVMRDSSSVSQFRQVALCHVGSVKRYILVSYQKSITERSEGS